MDVIAITIGIRDLQIDFGRIKEKNADNSYITKEEYEIKSVREKGEFILNNYELYKKHISTPIISPFIDYIKTKVSNPLVLLFCTNQNEKVDIKYREKDTFFFAKIIKKKIADSNITQENGIRIIDIKSNVIDMDSVYEDIKHQLKNSKKLRDIKPESRIYLLPVGGIPSLNNAILLNFIIKFKNNVKQFRVDEDQNVVPIKFNELFLKEFERNSIINALKEYNFASIMINSSNKIIAELAGYAYYRLSFNFSDAQNSAIKLMEDMDIRDKVSFINNMPELQHDKELQLKEIFYSAYIKIIQKQYVDALLRLYNFTDNLMSREVYNLLKLTEDFNKIERWWDKVIETILDKNRELESYLENKKINNKPIDPKKPGLHTYRAILEFFKSDVLSICNPLIKISGLRNKSIAAHGFQGVSEKNINESLSEYNMNIEELIRKVEDYLKAPFQESVYYKIGEIIKEELLEI